MQQVRKNALLSLVQQHPRPAYGLLVSVFIATLSAGALLTGSGGLLQQIAFFCSTVATGMFVNLLWSGYKTLRRPVR